MEAEELKPQILAAIDDLNQYLLGNVTGLGLIDTLKDTINDVEAYALTIRENKDFDLRKYLAEGKLLKEADEGKLLKEGLKLEQNPFDQQGLFLSSDGGRSGVFITTDLDFDITDYEMDGDEERGNLNGMGVRIISVYG